MVITVDTNFLIWGVRCVATDGQEEMIPRATAFFNWVDENRHKLVLSSECLAEYLVGATGVEKVAQLTALQEKFIILPYDAKAAAIAADLRSDKDFIKSQQAVGKTRVCIKSDIVVVATARAFGQKGVDRIYSSDPCVRHLATTCGMSAQDMPTVEQLQYNVSPSNRNMQKDLFA